MNNKVNIYELFPDYVNYIDNYINDYPYLKVLLRIFSKDSSAVLDIDYDSDSNIFNGLVDDGVFDVLLNNTDNLTKLFDIDNVPEKLIEYLNYLLNATKFNDDNVDKQRKILKNIIYYYQRRGTKRSLDGIFREANVDFNLINQKDNITSTSYNGKLSFLNAYLEDEKYYHEGSLIINMLNVINGINFDSVKTKVDDILPLGFIIWYVLLLYQTCDFGLTIQEEYSLIMPEVNIGIYDYDIPWYWNNTWVKMNSTEFKFNTIS